MSKAIVSILGVAGLFALAAADVEITEVYVGIDGNDGTVDWFELTNTGASAFDTGSLWYDDVSADFSDAVRLTSLVLNPGESAVFLIGGAGSEIDFEGVWGSGITVGFADGAGLGQGGDAVFLFNADQTIYTSLAYDASLADSQRTIESFHAGPAHLSTLGVNGAYESNAFFNDTYGSDPDFLWTLIGSPGAVPAPSSLALLGLGGLIATRRRR